MESQQENQIYLCVMRVIFKVFKSFNYINLLLIYNNFTSEIIFHETLVKPPIYRFQFIMLCIGKS